MKTTTIIVLYGMSWLIFTQASSAFLFIGIPVIAGAVWVRNDLRSSCCYEISFTQLLRFIPYFLWESIKGGVDVAYRTLWKQSKNDSGFFYYHCQLDSKAERIFFNHCVSMLPGTLTVDLNGDWIEIHSLHLDEQVMQELIQLEQVVAQLFISKKLKSQERVLTQEQS